MASDLVSYALLASVFVVTSLRMFIEKPGRLAERPIRFLDRLRNLRAGKKSSIDS